MDTGFHMGVSNNQCPNIGPKIVLSGSGYKDTHKKAPQFIETATWALVESL